MYAMKQRCSAVAFLMAVFLQGCSSIRITKVDVPDFIVVNGSGELRCDWEEVNDRMYSIKWYQAAHEFYRYTPGQSEIVQIFDPPTLDVDVNKSLGGIVHIANVSQNASGLFHCEVSADGPSFHTASEQANVTVVDMPDGDPVINGAKNIYSVGDWVDLTCTSRRSYPPAMLSFMVNNKEAQEEWMESQRDNIVDESGLTTSFRRLRLSLNARLLRNGNTKVICKAVILPNIYNRSTEEVLVTYRPLHASVLDGATAGCSRPTLGSSGVLTLLLLLLLLLLFNSTRPHL